MIKALLAAAALALLAVACASPASTPAHPSDTPVPTATAAAPTAIPPLSSRTPSPAPSPSPSPSPTPDPQRIVLDPVLLSPDGAWRSETMMEIHPHQARLLSRLMHNSGRQWLLEDSTHPPDARPPYPAALGWSPDSRYLYFTRRQADVENCTNLPALNGINLTRLDTASGEVVTLWEGNAAGMGVAPDGQYWVGLEFQADALLIHLRLLQEEQSWQLRWPLAANSSASPALGRLVWSPDGSALAVSVLHDACLVDYKLRYNSIVRLDLKGRSLLALRYHDRRGFQAVEWPEPERILVEDWLGKRYWLYVINAVVIPLSP